LQHDILDAPNFKQKALPIDLPMPDAPFINLVATRCLQNDHTVLQRWYADHVHLLLTSSHLQRAELFRCTHAWLGLAPDYHCIYDFESHEAFFQYEHSVEKAQATELTNAAAGRSSIEIMQRTQYSRWLHRQWSAPTSSAAPTWRLVICLDKPSVWTLDAQRWLADHLQALRACTALKTAQCYTEHTRPSHTLVALDFEGGEPAQVWELAQTLLAQPNSYGGAQACNMEWAASAVSLQAWLR
jgi:hypothetical protein